MKKRFMDYVGVGFDLGKGERVKRVFKKNKRYYQAERTGFQAINKVQVISYSEEQEKILHRELNLKGSLKCLKSILSLKGSGGMMKNKRICKNYEVYERRERIFHVSVRVMNRKDRLDDGFSEAIKNLRIDDAYEEFEDFFEDFGAVHIRKELYGCEYGIQIAEKKKTNSVDPLKIKLESEMDDGLLSKIIQLKVGGDVKIGEGENDSQERICSEWWNRGGDRKKFPQKVSKTTDLRKWKNSLNGKNCDVLGSVGDQSFGYNHDLVEDRNLRVVMKRHTERYLRELIEESHYAKNIPREIAVQKMLYLMKNSDLGQDFNEVVGQLQPLAENMRPDVTDGNIDPAQFVHKNNRKLENVFTRLWKKAGSVGLECLEIFSDFLKFFHEAIPNIFQCLTNWLSSWFNPSEEGKDTKMTKSVTTVVQDGALIGATVGYLAGGVTLAAIGGGACIGIIALGIFYVCFIKD